MRSSDVFGRGKTGIHSQTGRRGGTPPPTAAIAGLLFLLLTTTGLNAAHDFWSCPGMLRRGDAGLLQLPFAQFYLEVPRLQLKRTRIEAVPRWTYSPHEGSLRAEEVEVTELIAALKQLGIGEERSHEVRAAFSQARQKLGQYLGDHEKWQYRDCSWEEDEHGEWRRVEKSPPPARPSIDIPGGLPREFALYFEGALAWHSPNTTGKIAARVTWETLLQLPPEQRQFKSVWAAFMLGRSYEKEDLDKAGEWFQRTRALARAGFRDPLGLAAESLGYEARELSQAKRFEPAIDLYLEQAAAGDSSALTSLYFVSEQALESDADKLRQFARNERVSRVLTAYSLSRIGSLSWESVGGRSALFSWLEAATAAGPAQAHSAEPLALLACYLQQFTTAEMHLARAGRAPLADWLRAKILLNHKRSREALPLLLRAVDGLRILQADAARGSGESAEFAYSLVTYHGAGVPVWLQAGAELGALQLARGEYEEALQSFLAADFWIDAAYIAERILTLDELKDFVDNRWPTLRDQLPGPPPGTDEYSGFRPENLDRELRHLLARRLARAMRLAEARDYYPETLQPLADAWIRALDTGWNESLPNAQRATALFQAAVMTRTNGLELMSTEIAPDWHAFGAEYEGVLTPALRTGTNVNMIKARPDELRRYQEHASDPDQRWHYRYQAATLGFEAARLMPDNTEDTALVLCRSGSWIKHLAPKTADAFYQALIQRCPRTEIGAEAARLKWFPILEPDGRPRRDLTPTELEQAARWLRPAEGGYDYVVNSGDTVGRVLRMAKGLGHPVSFDELLMRNPELDPTKLRVGQLIFIPTKPPEPEVSDPADTDLEAPIEPVPEPMPAPDDPAHAD